MGCNTSSIDKTSSKSKTEEASIHSAQTDDFKNLSDKQINEFHIKYKLDGIVLGQGSYSIVKLATRLSDNRKVAVKIITRKKLSKEDERSVSTEANLLLSLKHPNIVQAFNFFEDRDNFYIVLEYLEGGELFERLMEKAVYNESEARDLYSALLSAVKYCHSKELVHRDIKPENILLASKQSDIDLKLADFGFAIKTDLPIIKAKAGTPGYVAPEIILGNPQGKPADMWSLGIVLYMLLGGYHPFFVVGDDQKNLYKKITNADYEFHPENWDNISEEAKDLIKNLLVLDTAKRFTINQALEHKWIKKPKEELAVRNLDRNLLIMKNYWSNRTNLTATVSGTNIAIDVIRKVSAAKSLNVNDVTIDVLRKLSGASITNDSLIESARKRSSKVGK